MSISKYLSALLLAPLLAAAPGACADPIYSATFLPRDFTAAALNRDGLVVGTAGGGAALWSPASTIYLAALLPGSEGTAINGDGVIAGRFGTQAFIYDGSVQTVSNTIPFWVTWASGINDAGQLSGSAREGLGINRGFFYSDGVFTDMGSFGGALSMANAINAGGQIAGLASFGTGSWSDPDYHAAVYANGTLADLGTLGGRLSEASDLNDAGFAVGWSELADGFSERPFLFLPDESRMLDLGSLGGSVGRANGINNAGTVVGLSDIGGADMGFDYHAFVYGADGMVDLNTLVKLKDGWTLVTALDVNDAGQILAQACRDGLSECRALRLDLIAAVPEPGSWAMLAAGMALLLWRARRRVVWIAAAPLLAAPLASAQQLPAQHSAATSPPAQYRPLFLPAGFAAMAINAHGHVAGYNGNAAVWNGRSVTDYAAVAPGSYAYGMNDHGTLVGFWSGDTFTFAASGVRDVGHVGLWDSSYGVAINNAGAVAGIGGWIGGERARGFVLANGVLRMIPSFGGDWSRAAAINRSGQVVGTAATADGNWANPVTRAFVFKDKTMRSLGTLGGERSGANDINDAGQVVGYSAIEDTGESGEQLLHPFLYSSGTMRDLGTLGGSEGIANGINNAGAVVGTAAAGTPEESAEHAFLVAGGAMVDLNSVTAMPADWVLVSARDINDAGQILARACRFEDCLHVRLDPAR